MENITEKMREKELQKRTEKWKGKDIKEVMKTIRKKLDNDKECKIKDKKVIQLLKIKYRLVIIEEYKKLHQDYINCLSGFYITLFSEEQINELINIIEYKMSYINSKEITLGKLKEEFEFVKEVVKRKYQPYGEDNVA